MRLSCLSKGGRKMGIRKRIRDGVSGATRSLAHKGLKISAKSLERTNKAIQDLKSKMDEKADSFLPENKKEYDEPE